MKNLYPDNVINKILQITLETQTFAYLAVDNQGILINQGGNIEALGLPAWSLQQNILDDALFLSGLIPMSSDYEILPTLQISETKVVDVHIFRDNNLNWAILVDKTDDIEWQSQARQKSNELQLLQQEINSQQESQSLKGMKEYSFEFFEALNMMALRLNEDGAFELGKKINNHVFFLSK